MPYKSRKTPSSRKIFYIYGLMTDLGLVIVKGVLIDVNPEAVLGAVDVGRDGGDGRDAS